MKKSIEWVNLVNRYGNSFESPQMTQLKRACQETIGEEAMTDREHPKCWLQCGFSDESLCVLDLYESGKLLFTLYSDWDMHSVELETSRSNVKLETAIKAFAALSHGNVEAVKKVLRIDCSEF